MRSVACVALAVLIGACAAGPDYVAPEIVAPESFANSDPTVFDEQREPGGLWASFDDEVLVTLIDHALVRNTDLAAALARMNESRALRGLSVYTLFPTVTMSAEATRNRLSEADPFAFPGLGVIETYGADFDATWEIDLFGRLRRLYRQIDATVEADAETLRDVQRSVVGELAQSYFALRGGQAQLRIQQANLDVQQQTVEILQASLDAGRGTSLDVARARVLERQLAAAIPLTEAALSRSEQRLAVLTALSLQELQAILGTAAATQDLPALPQTIDLGTPEQWLRRRPDVRAAERQLAAATEGIGVEASQYYPQLNLVGAYGWGGQQFGDLGDDIARRWRFGPSISWRFLDFGRVRQNVRAAEAREQQAAAAFQGALLRALEDMENSLATYRGTNAAVFALEEALVQSGDAAELARLRFDNGVAGFIEVLDAERTRLELADQVAQARTDRVTALVAVYKALAAD